MALLEIKNLSVRYKTDESTVRAVNDISLSIGEGETLGLVGETGAGKTTTALSIVRLVPDPPGEIVSGEIYYKGENLFKKSKKEMRKVRGDRISMIFQDPMTSLNPVLTIEDQLTEVIRLHQRVSQGEAIIKAAEMLELVGIPATRIREYPHQFSGGMKQRVVIAIALACNPELLIADEPTTALDVTIQAQVIDLMERLKEQFQTSMLMITHDLGVVAETCDRVAIMYAGEIVEVGAVEDLYTHMLHPYTQGLFGSIPNLDEDVDRLNPVVGMMPDPSNLPEGCFFHPRCPQCMERCQKESPPSVDQGQGHMVKCWLWARAAAGEGGA